MDKFATKDLVEAKQVLDAVAKFTTPLQGPADPKTLAAKVTEVDTARSNVDTLKVQWGEAIDRRNLAARELRDLVRRVRAAVEAQFGSNSPEYGMVGRKRTSERKRPSRKPAAG